MARSLTRLAQTLFEPPLCDLELVATDGLSVARLRQVGPHLMYLHRALDVPGQDVGDR